MHFNIFFKSGNTLCPLKCVTLQRIMVNVTALIQLKAFARQDAIVVFLLWLASFAVFVADPASSFGSLLAFVTPFLVGSLLAKFRNNALNGVISFRRGFAFSAYTFFYASLLFAVAQVVYFRFIDNGALATMLLNSANALEPIYKANGIPLDELKRSMTMVGQLSPIEISFVFMMQNLFIGFVLSLPIALVCRRTVAANRNADGK